MKKLGFSRVSLTSSQMVSLDLRSLTIDDGSGLPIEPPIFSGILMFPSATVDIFYSYSAAFLFNSGGTPVSYSLATGSIGNGITFNTETCLFSGTPTAASSFTGISLNATNTGGTSGNSNTSNLVINDPPVETSVFNGIWMDINNWNDTDIWADS